MISLNGATTAGTDGAVLDAKLNRWDALTCQVDGIAGSAGVTIYGRNSTALSWQATATGEITSDNVYTVDRGARYYKTTLTTASSTGAAISTFFGPGEF